MSTFRAQFLTLANQALQVCLNDPEAFHSTEEYARMFKKVEETSLSDFVIPKEFPPKCTEGRIFTSRDMRICVFFVPKGTTIPIHDHPEMNVICKILKGKIVYNEYVLENRDYQKSFPKQYKQSLVTPQNVIYPTIRAVKNTRVLQAGDITGVTPVANLHSFQSLQDTIFLDVICPDYNYVDTFMNMYEQIDANSQAEVLLKMNPPRLQNPPFIDAYFA